MQLSILIPSHRRDLLACSRIIQACCCAGPNIEVIVRDNSGDAQKRQMLMQVKRDNCKIIFADPCDASENFSETLRLARGEFVYFLADDDFLFERAIAALPDIIDKVRNDRSIVGVTGPYVIEASQGSAIVNYQCADADDVVERVKGFLRFQGPNVLYYSPLRREMAERIFAAIGAMPYPFSFHDQIMCLLYLLNGKFVRMQRLLYLYDFGLWELIETAQKRDVDFYAAAGLDPAINKLHWFLCGYEGAVLIRNSDLFPHYPSHQRQLMADCWFSVNYARFRGHGRLTFGSRFTDQADQLCARLEILAGQLSFDGMLAEISSFIELFSKAHAQVYFNYWSGISNKRLSAA